MQFWPRILFPYYKELHLQSLQQNYQNKVICSKLAIKTPEQRHRCFPVNFAKFLRTPTFIEHLRWLLLNSRKLLLNKYKKVEPNQQLQPATLYKRTPSRIFNFYFRSTQSSAHFFAIKGRLFKNCQGVRLVLDGTRFVQITVSSISMACELKFSSSFVAVAHGAKLVLDSTRFVQITVSSINIII